MAYQEISYIRDDSFSKWHRNLPKNWYMSDIDIKMWSIIDNKAKVVALIEEKNSNISKNGKLDIKNDFQIKALLDLAKDIPAFLMIKKSKSVNNYKPVLTFFVLALNDSAKEKLKNFQILNDLKHSHGMFFHEQGYFKFEAFLRKENASDIDSYLLSNVCVRFKLPVLLNYK